MLDMAGGMGFGKAEGVLVELEIVGLARDYLVERFLHIDAVVSKDH